MNLMSLEEFEREISLLAVSLGTPLSEHDIDDLFEAVADFSLEDVRAAVARWLERPHIYRGSITPNKLYRATWWMSQERQRDFETACDAFDDDDDSELEGAI